MTQVFIDPTKTSIAVQVLSQSMHAVGFQISVFEADGNTIREQHSGNTHTNNPATVPLNGIPGAYKGTFVSGTFTAISPDGSDGPYSIVFSISLSGATVNPTKSVVGTTNAGQDIAIGNFQLI